MVPTSEGEPEAPKQCPPPTTVYSTVSELSYFVSTTINNGAVSFLIDTGSAFTILRKDTFERICPDGPPLDASSQTFAGVNGNSLDSHGSCELCINIGGRLFNHRIFVLSDITTEALLGLDFLEAHGCTLALGAGELHFSRIGGKVPLCKGGQPDMVRPTAVLRVTATTRVPAMSEMEVLATLEGPAPDGMWLVEGRKTSSPPVLVARAVVTAQAQQSIPIRILNLGKGDVTLHGGSKVAMASPVDGPEVIECSAQDSHTEPSKPADLEGDLWNSIERVGDRLTQEQQEVLYTFLHSYSDIFASSSDDFGRNSLVQHPIDTGDAHPIRQQVRRIPPARRQEVTQLLQDMRHKDIIQPSTSPWASPIVLVRKKDGSMRFCVDYRKLNALTRKDAYPLPRIDDTLDTLSGAQWFSTLDLLSGYWQVEMDPADKPKTAFCTPEGLFEFNVMPFGLCNAPATFQRLMDSVLAGLLWTSCLVYLDDIIVMGTSFEDHLNNLAQVFDRLRSANLKLKPSKCSFACKEVAFLGHTVSDKGVATDPALTEKVDNWPEPQSVRDVQQFLGLASYYRRFVKDFARIAKPLHRLTEKSCPFHWTDECASAFRELRQRLVSAPVLAFPDFRQPFILDTDASDVGMGAVLSQVLDGQERVIAYASRTLSKPERRYCVTRRELLAVVTFVQHFRPYLLGSRFLLRTDHSSLTWLWNFKEPEGQIARWLERLQEYDFTVQHRPGKKHSNADALSRLPCHQCGRESHSHMTLPEEVTSPVLTIACGGQSATHLRELQLADPDVGPILRGRESNQKPPVAESLANGPGYRRLHQMWEQLTVKDGILWRVFESNDGNTSHLQLVTPTALRAEVLQDVHGGTMAAHLGEDKTMARLKERYYWPGHYNDVKKWCQSCAQCATRKAANPKRRGPLQSVLVGYPMQLVAVDILGPLPESPKGNSYLLVVGDYFTRWMEAYPIPSQEASTVARTLTNEFFLRFSPPEQLHSDQGRQFEAQILAEVCRLLKIKKTQTTPYHPQSDGLVERFNRTLLSMLSTMVGGHHDTWEDHVRSVCMAYNTSLQPTTGYSPFFLMFGRKARLPIELAYGTSETATHSPNEYAAALQKSLGSAFEQVRKNFKLRLCRQKDFYDRKVHGQHYRRDALVWLHSSVVPKGQSRKLHHPWTGPYRVVKQLSDVTYRIQHTLGRKNRLVVHFDRLKPCIGGPNPQDEALQQPPPITTSSTEASLTPPTFGDHLETTDAEDMAVPPSQSRYPPRAHHPPDRYGVPVWH